MLSIQTKRRRTEKNPKNPTINRLTGWIGMGGMTTGTLGGKVPGWNRAERRREGGEGPGASIHGRRERPPKGKSRMMQPVRRWQGIGSPDHPGRSSREGENYLKGVERPRLIERGRWARG